MMTACHTRHVATSRCGHHQPDCEAYSCLLGNDPPYPFPGQLLDRARLNQSRHFGSPNIATQVRGEDEAIGPSVQRNKLGASALFFSRSSAPVRSPPKLHQHVPT
uniref:Uncharacterized protein n=1 Tax=Cacopsylla melanoneura TaxID=428564 RepID=A0A8D9F8C6_9HEMI